MSRPYIPYDPRKNPVISLSGGEDYAHVQQAVAAAGMDPRNVWPTPTPDGYYSAEEAFNWDDYEDAEREPGEVQLLELQRRLPGWHISHTIKGNRNLFRMTPPGRKNPTDGMGIVEALAWGLAAAGALYLIFRPSTASAAAVVPASAARIPPAAQPRAPVTDADHAIIVGVQDRLRAVGYQPGPSTGTWTHDTNYAIANLQHDEGLPATGILDGTTAQRLAAKYARVQSATATPATAAEEEGFWSNLLTMYG